MKQQPFVTSLTAEPSYRLGDPILITFEIENSGGDTYQVLKWGTPLEGSFTTDYLIVQRDGELIPYDGKLVKRGEPSSDAYVLIRPGERLKFTVDISEAYSIDQVGDYIVTLNASFFDVFVVPSSSKVVRASSRLQRGTAQHFDLGEKSCQLFLQPSFVSCDDSNAAISFKVCEIRMKINAGPGGFEPST